MKRVVKNQNTISIEDAVGAKTVFVENSAGEIGIIVKKLYSVDTNNITHITDKRYFVRFPSGSTRFRAGYDTMESLIENLIDDNYKVYVE